MTSKTRLNWFAMAALAALTALPACASKGQGDEAKALGKAARSAERIGVNSFLWRASLDTLSFMPLASADPYGGVIITDWYANPERPNERFKATVYILDTRLRADALNVSINKQQLTVNGWGEAAIDPATAVQIENAILTRARQLKLSTVS